MTRTWYLYYRCRRPVGPISQRRRFHATGLKSWLNLATFMTTENVSRSVKPFLHGHLHTQHRPSDHGTSTLCHAAWNLWLWDKLSRLWHNWQRTRFSCCDVFLPLVIIYIYILISAVITPRRWGVVLVEHCTERVCLFASLHVCLQAYLKNETFEFHQFSDGLIACCLWPWLDPPLATLQYVRPMYFQFCGLVDDDTFAHNRLGTDDDYSRWLERTAWIQHRDDYGVYIGYSL